MRGETQYQSSIIKLQMSIAKITPATESAKACIASRLTSNFSAFTADLPRRNGALSFTDIPLFNQFAL